MCGVVGYSGYSDANVALLGALDALEYRGYDSAGISVQQPNGDICTVKSIGDVSNLRSRLNGQLDGACAGIAHTRWATHGAVTEANAHPHVSFDGKIVIAHNGIVENYSTIRADLTSRGIRFASETDSEAIAHLIALSCESGASLLEATREVALSLQGLSVILAMSTDEPSVVVGARTGWAGSLILGQSSDGDYYLTSSVSGMPPDVRSVIDIDHCEAVQIGRGEAPVLTTLDGSETVDKPARSLNGYSVAARGNYQHFMLKEIMDQPSAVHGALRGRADFTSSRVDVPELSAHGIDGNGIDRVLVIGMGSSYFVAISAANMIESIAGIPARPAYAGDLSDSGLVITPNTLVMAVTQSGETFDTLLGLEEARIRGAKTVLLTANMHSEGARISDIALDIGTGTEAAVPATKTVTCSMLTSYLVAHHLAYARANRPGSNHVPAVAPVASQSAEQIDSLSPLPRLMNSVLNVADSMHELARNEFALATSAIIIGRGGLYPVVLEGALKLKEVAYIHAEGCSAAEMKHGINALIDESTPTIALVSADPLQRTKMLSSINEVKARGGTVVAIASDSSTEHVAIADRVVSVPDAPIHLEPLMMLPPLQLLAYHCALARGINPDRPRNLAKTVTVA